MAEGLIVAAAAVLITVAAGLIRAVRGPTRADRMMAVQLLGTGGIAIVLLLGAAVDSAAAVDVALILALLATFAAGALFHGARIHSRGERRTP
jgi:multicomponent Na+:H+ antiporter subunit F